MAQERKQLEKTKRSELKQLQSEVAQILSDTSYQDESRENPLVQKRCGLPQTPLRAALQIFIGEFAEQENEFMHNRIISFYKQFF